MRVKIDDDESAAMDPKETLQLLQKIEANTAIIGNQADDDIRASVAEVQTLKKKVRSNYRSGRLVGPPRSDCICKLLKKMSCRARKGFWRFETNLWQPCFDDD